ncbi:hypothetical protein BN1184_BS_00700 [Pantoea ananatis]|nr:hypothetical protein BN1182_CI_00690 [Pantoea ananatis]CRH39852.1 hypothetical protein BN1184_BS_00700 [Pantoea ananatis]
MFSQQKNRNILPLHRAMLWWEVRGQPGLNRTIEFHFDVMG